ncbi:uncharacterized protein LOC127718204 isoform X2 [Mytilus californianus]|uniref:uncharacterized protein LOC127718204 isoform X2 n=1 Tax=Mytilus californianus TaxID=6549 RepID=UPI0022470184|nr:uncharacterized protein LOC127718204 isoform X2 [Mytilus californianus]
MSEKSVSLNDFDINLLETLLKRYVNLESDDKMWLSTIREIRNCIAHATSTTEFDPGRLDKWWMKLEGSILGLVRKIPPAFYGEAIESQINALKNSNMEAIYAKKLMDDVKAENMILLEDLVERSDIRIGDCENNIKQAITENNNEFKRYLDEKTGGIMRKLEELEAQIKASAKQDPSTNFRSEHDSTRKIHVACQVEADDIDEQLTIKNLSDPDRAAADESGDGGFKVVNVKQKCILLELTASPEILSSEERLLNAIDQLINQVVCAGKLDTRVPGKMTLNLTFTSPLSREELDVFSRVFCTSDKAEVIDSDVMNQIQDYSIGTVTRETQTEIVTEDISCQVDMKCKQCSMIDDHSDELGDELLIRNVESSTDVEADSGSLYSIAVTLDNDGKNEEKYTDETGAEGILVDSNHSTWITFAGKAVKHINAPSEREFFQEYTHDRSFCIDGIIKDVKILDKNTIIIASYGNKQLVIIDWKYYLQEQIPLDDNPSKLAVINPDIVALIMHDRDYILIFNIYNRVPTKLIVGKKLCGIGYSNERLYVGCKDQTIQVLSLKGEFKATIKIPGTEIHNMCASKNRYIYFTSYIDDKLMCIDTRAKQIIIIQDSKLLRPRGITMDENDNILVSCHRSTEVFRVSSDGKKTTKIMDTETFNGFPCICCDLETRSLIIGGCDTIYIYRKLQILRYNNN